MLHSSILGVDAIDALATTSIAGGLAIAFDFAAFTFIAWLIGINHPFSTSYPAWAGGEEAYQARAMYLRRFFRDGSSCASSTETDLSQSLVADASARSILRGEGAMMVLQRRCRGEGKVRGAAIVGGGGSPDSPPNGNRHFGHSRASITGEFHLCLGIFGYFEIDGSFYVSLPYSRCSMDSGFCFL